MYNNKIWSERERERITFIKFIFIEKRSIIIRLKLQIILFGFIKMSSSYISVMLIYFGNLKVKLFLRLFLFSDFLISGSTTPSDSQIFFCFFLNSLNSM